MIYRLNDSDWLTIHTAGGDRGPAVEITTRARQDLGLQPIAVCSLQPVEEPEQMLAQLEAIELLRAAPLLLRAVLALQPALDMWIALHAPGAPRTDPDALATLTAFRASLDRVLRQVGAR